MPLPNQIPPPNVPPLDSSGHFQNQWYLWLYALSAQVMGTGGQMPSSAVDLMDMIDLEASSADVLQAHRELINAQLLLDRPERSGPTPQDVVNALLLATDPAGQDPAPRAQPIQGITVGASPFTFQALAKGAVAISGGTVAAISITRAGATVPTSVVAGVIPLSRLDQLQVTYTVAPTMNFLPS